jgi:transposase-like protein
MQRKKHSAAFKAKVALEAIKENRTSAELSSAYGVHTTMITRWKRPVLEYLPDIFSDKAKRKDKNNEELLASLCQQIGQLKVEVDWLKKKSTLLK